MSPLAPAVSDGWVTALGETLINGPNPCVDWNRLAVEFKRLIEAISPQRRGRPAAPMAASDGHHRRYSSRFRDELLNQEVFADLREAESLSAWWQNEYNHRRPHSSLGYVTPARFAASPAGPSVGATPLPPAQQADQPTPILS